MDGSVFVDKILMMLELLFGVLELSKILIFLVVELVVVGRV
jgi:hypothetical protein